MVLVCSKGFESILKNSTWFWGFKRGVKDSKVIYMVLEGSIGLYRVLKGPRGFHRVPKV